jgi:predicted Ser/Thr protein kinase
MVIQEGAGKWMTATSIPGLFPATPVPSEALTVRPTQVSPGADPTGQAVSTSLSTVQNQQTTSAAAGKEAFPEVPGFQMIRVLGKGGMGVVYLARNLRTNRVEALKMIRADSLAGLPEDQRWPLVERFRTEYQVAARIQHDHVVTVYEVGETGGCPFYSMRYVEGQSLADVLQKGPIGSARAAALLEPVARAVHFVHGHGVLHRDIKPRNILVDSADRPYVTDFGLAKWREAGQDLTHTGDWLGTPSYMAPEQAQDAGKVTAASDVYALGATLYALLTGRPPFQGATVAETVHQLNYQEPVAPRRLNPAIARDLETITLKCLEKEPARRYPSAGELADELQRFREGRSIRARPAGSAERVWRWCRRNRIVASLLAALALLLILLPVVAGIGYLNTSAALEETKRQETRAIEERNRLRDERDRVNGFRYISEMWEGGHAVVANDLPRVKELVRRNLPKPGWADPRDWEWHVLNRVSKKRGFRHLRAFPHAWSPDGRRLATFTPNHPYKVLSVRNATTGKEICSLGDPWRVSGLADEQNRPVAWSPDGKWLATLGDPVNSLLQVWNAATGERVFWWKKNFSPTYSQITLGPRGTRVFSSHRGNEIAHIAWGPDSKRLAVVGKAGEIRLWQLFPRKKAVLLSARAGLSKGGLIAWRPDGQSLASRNQGGQIQISNTNNGNAIVTLDASAFSPSFLPDCMIWSPNGRHLAAMTANGISVWNTQTGKTLFAVPGTWAAAGWDSEHGHLNLAGSRGRRSFVDEKEMRLFLKSSG